MLPLSSNSHVPFQRIGRSQSIKSTDDHENRVTGSRASRLLGKLKAGSGSKRKQASVGSPAPSRTSSNDGGASPFRLAQRLRTLLDAHPVNSPAPSYQPLPTPETSPSPPLVPRSFQQSEPFPTSPVAGPSNQTPESSVSSPTTFFSAPSSPADAELAALLSSPILPIGAVAGGFDFPPFDTPATPLAGPSTAVYQAHTPASLSPARHEAVFNFLDRIGSPKARARRLSRATVDGSPSRDGRQSLNASPRAWPASPAISSISSVLASGSVTAAYGSDGMRHIEEETSDDDDDEDDTSIMMYSPLMPTPTSLVAIAESEISVVAVHEDPVDEEEVEPVQDTPPPPPPAPEPQPPQQAQSSGWGLSRLWPFTSWFSSTSPTSNSTPSPSNAASNTNPVEPPAATPRAQQSTALSTRPTSTQVRLRRRRVWVPSRTQLSLETTWWGYRIYIPPPVLDALDSTSIETTRRAALLTAALTWFFTNLPVNVLPITVRPVIVILQGLVPYLGYLGGILSWSWGTIRSYDEGYGIILSATWLMPIALIPSTWVPPPSEWPGSPLSITSTHSTPAPSTLSATSLSTLSPTISQSTSPPPSSSPALSQSTMTPTPMSPSSLPISPYPLLRQGQSLEPPQGQQYPVYSPTLVRSPAPSLPLTQEYTQESPDQAQLHDQRYLAYSPYDYTMLSPLTQLSASFPSPVMNPSYRYTYGQPFPATTPTPPIMAMSVISPIPANGAVMYSPTMAPLPVSSPYLSPSASPTPSSASGLPLTSTPSMSQRRTRKRNGSLYAPRMATVPLPDDDR